MSDLLKTGLKAMLPMIRVTTDDPVSVEQVLQSIAVTKNIQHIENLSPATLYKVDTLLWTDKATLCTVDTYEVLDKKEKTLVFVNCPANTLVFDAGELLPTPELIQQKVKQYTQTDLRPVLTGLSLKAIDELLRLTSVKFGNLLPSSLKSMRAILNKPVVGLVMVDSTQKLYYPHAPLEKWVVSSKPYFLSTEVNPILRPRGILLYGNPGGGKTSSAKYIANVFGVPLYRLDLSSSLNKYLGNSESNLARILTQVESYSPCTLLIDEVEKLFTTDSGSDGGVMQRLLSQLLWWLAEHQTQVFTVMTTNDRNKIPPELFREGRIDLTMEIPELTAAQATELGHAYMKYLLGGNLTMKQATSLKFNGPTTIAAAKVLANVIEIVKINKWGLEPKK